MPTYNAGSASVRIRPDASGFIRDLRADLARHSDPGFTVAVDANIRPAVETIQRLRQAVSKTDLTLDVDVDTTKGTQALRRWRLMQGVADVQVSVAPDTKSATAALAQWRSLQRSAPINITANVDVGGALAKLTGFRTAQASDAVALNVDVDLGAAAAQLEAFRAAQAANAVEVRVDASTAAAAATLAAFRAQQAANGVTVDAGVDLATVRAQLAALRQTNESNPIVVPVHADTALARTEIARLREWAERNIDIGVGLNMLTMNAKLDEWRRIEEGDTLIIPVDVDTTRAIMGMMAFRQMQESNSFNVFADVVTTTASSEMARWRREQEANALNIRVNANTRGGNNRGGRSGMMGLAAITGLSQIPMAALGVANLAAALQQLAQVGLVVPGVMAGVISSVGTLAMGLSGITDAYKAVSDAADSSGADQAAQARAAATAHTQLRNAVVDEADAQKDVARARRDARQQLADLNIELRGGQISEARALLELQRAQQELATGDYTDQADAVLRVAETEQNLLEVRARNADLQQQANEANAAGVEGSDAVVSAQERLVRTQQQVADAQLAVADSASAMSTDATAAAEALDKLSPSAREFVETLIGNKGAFSDLRTSVQETMFNGLSGDLQGTLTSLMPVLDQGLGAIANGWNQTFEELFTSVGSDRSTGLLDRILGNSGEAQSRFATAVDPIIDSVLTLMAAGSDHLPRIADAIGDVAERFSTWLSEADADGRLAEWIDEGLDGMTNLGNTVLNIGEAIDGITDSVDGNFLQALEVGTGKLADFLNSTEGQNKLREFFDHGEDMLNAWKPILEALPGIFMGAMEGSGAAVQTLLAILSPLTTLLAECPELVGAIAVAFTAVLVGSAVRTAIMSLVAWIGTVRTALVGASAATGLMGAISAVATGPLGLIAIGTAAAAAFLIFRDEVDATIERTKALEQAQQDLMDTLDQVSGRITAQTRQGTVDTLRDFTSANQGGPSGDVIAAGQALGLDPYQVTNAALGDTAAQQAITDVLIGNNLAPEFAANPELAKILEIYQGLGASPATVYAALLGDTAANQQLNDLTNSIEGDAAFQQAMQNGQLGRSINSTYDIAQMLSQSGRNALLVGNAVGQQSGLLPGAQTQAQADNQAVHGTPELTTYGSQVFGPGAMVQYDGANYVVTTENLAPDMVATLRDRGHTVQEPVPPSTTWQIVVASDRVGDLVKPMKSGGPTPSGRGPGPTGGFFTELHDDEFVISKRGRAQVPDSFLYALNRGDIDPSVIAGLQVPGFEVGGDPREQDPNDWHAPGGVQTSPGRGPLPGPAPVAPNPTTGQPGGILGAVNTAVNGLQTPLNNLTTAVTPAAPTSGKPTPQNPFAWLPQPGQDMSTWNPFAGAPDKLQPQNIAAQFGETLLTGVLSFFGLENSILSPNNEYRQALDQALGFYTGTNQNTGSTGLNLPSSLQIPGAPTGMLVTDSMLQQLYSDPNAVGNLTAVLSPGASGQQISDYILNKAMSLGYSRQQANYFATQAFGESGFRSDANGGNQDGTGDVGGVFQFTPGTWGERPGSMWNAQDNIDQYFNLARERGLTPETFLDPTQLGTQVSIGGPYHPQNVGHRESAEAGVQAYLDAFNSQQSNVSAALAPNPDSTDYIGSMSQIANSLGVPLYSGVRPGDDGYHGNGTAADFSNGTGNTDQMLALANYIADNYAAYTTELIYDDPRFTRNINNGQFVGKFGEFYTLGQAGPHHHHVHWAVSQAPSVSFDAGGPTPSGRGNGPTGGFLAEVHADEFMISALGRSKVPDSFLHALNEGRVTLPGFAAGGDPRLVRTGVVPRPPAPPRPPDAQRVVPRTPAPRPPSVPGPTPAAPTTPSVSTAPPAPTPSTPSVPPPTPTPVTAPTPTAAPPASWDHNLGAIDTAIDSTASVLGNIAGTAASMGMAAGGGGAGGGLAGSMISGLFSQGGKIAKDAVNVISSFLVGSVPGSMGEPGAPAYGTTLRPDQFRPSTADYRPSGGYSPTFNAYGFDFPTVRRELNFQESMDMQAGLAHRPA